MHFAQYVARIMSFTRRTGQNGLFKKAIAPSFWKNKIIPSLIIKIESIAMRVQKFKKMGWKKNRKKIQKMLKIGVFVEFLRFFDDFQHFLIFFRIFFQPIFFAFLNSCRNALNFDKDGIILFVQNSWGIGVLLNPFCPVCKLKMWRLIIQAP